MGKARAPRVRKPGEEPRAPAAAPQSEASDDAAIDAGQAGGTHRVAKHPPADALPKSKVKGDPQRPKTAAVNAKKEMPYAEAMKLREAGTLKRSVLTDQGWVVPIDQPNPAVAGRQR